MSDYHEPYEALSDEARDIHRAVTSLKEEIEAVDWYHQRVTLCSDESLREILAHNRDEEIEHAVMTLEWLRRTMPEWDRNLRRYLFTEGPIHAAPIHAAPIHAAPIHAKEQRPQAPVIDLGIGSRKR